MSTRVRIQTPEQGAAAFAGRSRTGTRAVGRDEIVIDVRDWGVIGDGTSRPLSGLFGTLALAQAVYPAAVALTDELDWAAFQSALVANPGARFVIHRSLVVLINRPLVPTSHSRWVLDGEIKNNHAYNTPSTYQDLASCLRMGNMHPAIINRAYVNPWIPYDLSPVANGDNFVTIITPAGLTLAAGAFCVVASSSNPDPTGVGVIPDVGQINKVKTAYTGTGPLVLEMPLQQTIIAGTPPITGAGGAPAVPVLVAGAATTGGRFLAGTCTGYLTSVNVSGESAPSTAVPFTMTAGQQQPFTWSAVSGATGYNYYRTDSTGNRALIAQLGAVTAYTDTGTSTIVSGPVLWVNNGLLDVNGQPWWMLDNFVLEGEGKLTGVTPFGMKMGAWRCRAKWRGDTQDLLSAQACVKSKFEVTGEFTSRLLELKFLALDSEVYAHGVYRLDASITPLTTISIGEQARGNKLTGYLYRGTAHAANVRALEEYGQANTVQMEIHDFSTGGQTEVFAVKSTGNLGRSPSDVRLDLRIRAGGGKVQYGLIGSDANGDTLFNDADPTRVSWMLNCRTPDGVGPSYSVQSTRGTQLIQESIRGDAMRVNPINPSEVPERGSYLLAVISGAVTYATGDTLLASYTVNGCKLGDRVDLSMQQIATPTSGSFGDLFISGTVSAANTVRVYVRNRSATSVVFGTGTVMWLQAAWQRMRT